MECTGEDEVLVREADVRALISSTLQAAGTGKEQADILADVLVSADRSGIYSHGANRLELYMNELVSQSVDGAAVPEVLKETAATAWVDGHNGLGSTVGVFCMDLAIKKAKEVGFAIVSAKGSNHFGTCGWYAMRAVQQGLLGMAFTNSDAVATPTRSKKPAMGTNPLAVAAPGDEDHFLCDMATTRVPLGKVEVARRKGKCIPEGWVYDNEGKVATDPLAILGEGSGGGLAPLGGAEHTGGYKGYGLGLMVEVLTGVLSGGNTSHEVPHWWHGRVKHEPSNLGQCFIAVDPSVFAPGFTGRLTDLLQMCRSLPSVDPSEPVLVPGDPENIHEEKCRNLGGIPYHHSIMTHVNKVAARFNIPPLIPIQKD